MYKTPEELHNSKNTNPTRLPSGIPECLKNRVLYSVFRLDISDATMKSYPNRYIS